jgi:hypothetical protein
LATVLALALATQFGACGGESSPTGPTLTLSVDISASRRVVPTVWRMNTGDPTRGLFELRGAVTFKDDAATGLQLSALEIDVVDVAARRAAVGGDRRDARRAARPAPPDFTLPAGREPMRVRVRASGRDREGRMRVTGAVEAPVVFVAGGGGTAVGGEVTFVGAGDIADCSHTGSQATARCWMRFQESPTLGDFYPVRRPKPSPAVTTTWGCRGRTQPVPVTRLGRTAGSRIDYGAPPDRTGYYSFNLGAWHIWPQQQHPGEHGVGAVRLRRRIWRLTRRCARHVAHHVQPGPTATREMQQIWWFESNGVDLVLSGHEHMYERFARQDNEGNPRPNGMRLIVAGTGGAPLSGPQLIRPNSEVRGAAWGVLKLTLRPENYSWQFVPVPGSTFTDSGTDICR